jgi:antitoxin (DNA-binding transcriptional repressor) of toxin-antitoxin stability system
MDTIISVQEIRTSLGAIASRAEAGESFTVVRNSKPAFRIVPLARAQAVREQRTAYGGSDATTHNTLTAREIRDRMEKSGASEMLTPEELDRIIHEVHHEANQQRGKGSTAEE